MLMYTEELSIPPEVEHVIKINIRVREYKIQPRQSI